MVASRSAADNETVVAYATLQERLARSSASGGEPPGGGDMEHRVPALEKNFATMNGKLDKLLDAMGDLKVTTARIEEKLETKASAVEVASLSATAKSLATAEALGIVRGRVDSLPSTWQMITLVIGIVGTILGGAFLILRSGLPHTP